MKKMLLAIIFLTGMGVYGQAQTTPTKTKETGHYGCNRRQTRRDHHQDHRRHYGKNRHDYH